MVDNQLPQIPETNIRKWIFVGVICGVLFFVIAFFVFMGGAGKTDNGKNFNPEKKEVSIWVVDIPAKTFTDLTAGFNKYLGRNDMKLDVRNFASFEDYIDILPRAIESGQSPDIVVVPNHGGYRFFDQYINALGSDMVNFTDFETRFHKLFFEELVFSEKQKVDGQDKVVQGLKGIPYGFEPMGIYYNREIVDKVPELWETFPEILKKPELEDKLPEAENKTLLNVERTVKVDTSITTFTNMGYGRVTASSADIIPLLTLQKKGPTYNSYTTVNSIESRAIVEEYLGFRREPNNLAKFQSQFDETLTTTDLFARGKVGTLIGYPSTFKDIKIAIQRARDDDQLSPTFVKSLRIATIPQEETDPKKQLNFAKYMYFAMTKNGKNRDFKKPQNDGVIKFVQYLLTEDAQLVFLKNAAYMLPTQKVHLTDKKDTKINPDSEFDMTIADWYVSTQSFALYDMGVPHLFRSIMKQAIDEPGVTANVVTANVSGYLTCKIGQLTDPLLYDNACLCKKSLPNNRNNYWPLCGQE